MRRSVIARQLSSTPLQGKSGRRFTTATASCPPKPGASLTPYGDSKEGAWPLSQREQSEPGVPGHGRHGWVSEPPTSDSHGWHSREALAGATLPLRQRGPSSVAGIGSRAHIEPVGRVPLETNEPFTERRVPLGQTSACFDGSKSRG